MKQKRKKISAFLPADLLAEATRLSDSSQTDAIVLGLQELVRAYKRNTISSLKGRIKIDFDVNRDRERSRF